MTFNFNNAELLGKELGRDRMREAEKERLIKQSSGWNPGPIEKFLNGFRTRWNRSWFRFVNRKVYISFSGDPKNSTSQ